ncbi:hypothetical protein [Aerococcus urinaeequi]
MVKFEVDKNQPFLKTVKLFSKDFLNGLPIRESINLNSTINKKLVRLSYKDIKNIEELIIG